VDAGSAGARAANPKALESEDIRRCCGKLDVLPMTLAETVNYLTDIAFMLGSIYGAYFAYRTLIKGYKRDPNPDAFSYIVTFGVVSLAFWHLAVFHYKTWGIGLF
jgi:hypothetical protein